MGLHARFFETEVSTTDQNIKLKFNRKQSNTSKREDYLKTNNQNRIIPFPGNKKVSHAIHRKVPEWSKVVPQHMRVLLALKDDWDNNGAESPSKWVLDITQKVFNWLILLDLQPSYVDPDVENGVVFSFYTAPKSATIEIDNEIDIFITISINNIEDSEVIKIMESELFSEILKIKSKLAIEYVNYDGTD